MPTKKQCQFCKTKIGVASKTCQHCGAKQPYKSQLENLKKKCDHNWKERQRKNSSVNKVYDATNLLLHKWELLERHPILLLARKTSSGFVAESFCPWQMDTKDAEDAIVTIKKIYEGLLNVTTEPATRTRVTAAPNSEDSSVTESTSTPVFAPESDTEFTLVLPPVTSSSTQSPPVPPFSMTAAVSACSVTPPVSTLPPPHGSSQFQTLPVSVSSPSPPLSSSSLSPPASTFLASLSSLTLPSSTSLSPLTTTVSNSHASPVSALSPSDSSKLPPVLTEVGTPDSAASSHNRRQRRNKMNINECLVHQVATSFPYKRILMERVREGFSEVLVQWLPCTGCGAKWKNSWEPKHNLQC